MKTEFQLPKLKYIEDVANSRFNILLENIYDLRITFFNGIAGRVKQMRVMGIGNEEIEREIIKSIYDQKEVLPNKENKELWNYFKSVSQYQVWSNIPQGEELYTWQYNPGASHCPDCLERNGKTKTFKAWESLGLPGSGSTKCRDNCMCDLVPK
jgi:hypothetical protein